jgi:hypothetical protein
MLASLSHGMRDGHKIATALLLIRVKLLGKQQCYHEQQQSVVVVVVICGIIDSKSLFKFSLYAFKT